MNHSASIRRRLRGDEDTRDLPKVLITYRPASHPEGERWYGRVISRGYEKQDPVQGDSIQEVVRDIGEAIDGEFRIARVERAPDTL